VLFVRPTNSGSIERLVTSLRSAELTYSDVGCTLTGGQPVGFRHDRHSVVVGHGSPPFERAIEGLKTWQAHRLPGVRVFPNRAEVRSDTTVVVTLGSPLLALAAPCRIVQIVDDPDRWGFAYGTLPGHPEQGEEAFLVSISPDGEVRFEVSAFSRPGDRLTRLSGPLGRQLQRVGAKGYGRALRRFVARAG
jgi:uncharacterized protein (UPF0548 family)